MKDTQVITITDKFRTTYLTSRNQLLDVETNEDHEDGNNYVYSFKIEGETKPNLHTTLYNLVSHIHISSFKYRVERLRRLNGIGSRSHLYSV